MCGSTSYIKFSFYLFNIYSLLLHWDQMCHTVSSWLHDVNRHHINVRLAFHHDRLASAKATLWEYGSLSLLAVNHNTLKAPISQIAASEYFSLLGICLRCKLILSVLSYKLGSNLSTMKVGEKKDWWRGVLPPALTKIITARDPNISFPFCWLLSVRHPDLLISDSGCNVCVCVCVCTAWWIRWLSQHTRTDGVRPLGFWLVSLPQICSVEEYPHKSHPNHIHYQAGNDNKRWQIWWHW